MAKITKKELIDLLNRDLALEYTAIMQYTQHQGTLKGAMYQSIQKELIIHAQEELQHATIIAAQIDYLGGVPTIDTPPAKVSKDSVTMLKQDLEGENDAIARYIRRIRQAEDLDLDSLLESGPLVIEWADLSAACPAACQNEPFAAPAGDSAGRIGPFRKTGGI